MICVAPNGARRSRKDHERIPLTPEELAREAVSCVEAGASVMHLHVRASDGGHSLDPAIYRSALAAIRATDTEIDQLTRDGIIGTEMLMEEQLTKEKKRAAG